MISFLPILTLALLAGLMINLAVDLTPALQGSHRWGDAWASLRTVGFQSVMTTNGTLLHFRWMVAPAAAGVIGVISLRQTNDTMAALRLAGWGWFLLAIALIDLKHKVVLNKLLLISLPLLVLSHIVTGRPTILAAIAGAAFAFGLFALIIKIQPRGMGIGDLKFAMWIGFAVGFPAAVHAILLGIIFGGIAAAVMLVVHRQTGRKIAYAPYLALGAWLVLLAQLSV
ncbi:MAG: prepilin peptidase [Caldilineales bacterium]|nr:prepilin peptidase [Caldilineales bacterium]